MGRIVYHHIPGIQHLDDYSGRGPVWRQSGTRHAHGYGMDRGSDSTVVQGKIQLISGVIRIYRPIPIPLPLCAGIYVGGL